MEDFIKEPQPLIARKPELIYGLRNIIQNAMDFSVNKVWLDVKYNNKVIIFEISDDGLGFPAHLIDRIGDPFLIEGVEDKYFDISRPHYEGMGLGLFIAKTLLERLGGSVTFNNKNRRGNKQIEWANEMPRKQVESQGAIVRVEFSLSDLEEKNR